MLPAWTEPNNKILQTLEENVTVTIPLPVADPSITSTTLISGSLPTGLRIQDNSIVGTPVQVARTTTKTFVVRASTDEGILDRTFKLIVEGADNPQWIQPEGRLPVGPNQVYYILDSTPIDFQLLAEDQDLPAGDELKYYIQDGDGVLPPGIELTTSGKIIGTVEPLLALDVNERDSGYDNLKYGDSPFDYGVISASGLDSFFYDLETYDFAEKTLAPKKLNRTYEFIVTVADNVSSTKRKFSIYVVGDDYVRADNTIMRSADGVFTADASFLRTPIWVTPNDLGRRRANNYQTVYLDTIDPNNTSGTIRYILQTINEDGSESVLPPGLTLDSRTGELAGIVPYMPAVSKTYDFTVSATRFDSDEGLVTVYGTFIEDTMSGVKSFKIAKLPQGTDDGVDDLNSLVKETIEIYGNAYTVESIVDTDPDHDVVTLTESILPIKNYNVLKVAKFAGLGQEYFYVNTLSTNDQEFYKEKTLTFGSTENVITDVYPYVEYNITPSDSSDFLELDTSVTGTENGPVVSNILSNFLSVGDRQAYVTEITDLSSNILEIKMFIPSTANNRNINFIKSCFTTTVDVDNSGEYDKIQLDSALTSSLDTNRQISLGLATGGSFQKTLPRAELDTVESRRTFTIELIGEVESVINWKTPANLGTIRANRPSTLSIKAITDVEDSLVTYSLTSGHLPFGLSLKSNGEITGKVANIGTVDNLGLTLIDGGNTTFDNTTQTYDRIFEFTVEAKDRFAYSATTRTFKLSVDDTDEKLYSNIYIQPFLKQTQRNTFNNFVNDLNVFDPQLVYRPSDENFGIQKNLKSLVFAGLEQSTLTEFTAAVSKNHKKKNFLFGNIKTAVAKAEGSNEVVYEVVYAELIDPAKPKKGKTAKSFKTLSKNKITVDSVRLEGNNDNTLNTDAGGIGLSIAQRDGTTYLLPSVNGRINVSTRTGITVEIGTAEGVPVLSQVSQRYFIRITSVTTTDLSSPWRFRPNGDTLTIDNANIKASQSNDILKYISNIDNMRDALDSISDKSVDFRPLWMRTPQQSDLEDIGFVFCVPLVYTIPGQSETLKQNIENSGFDFKSIEYTIDRYIVDSVTNETGEQYVFFADYNYNV